MRENADGEAIKVRLLCSCYESMCAIFDIPAWRLYAHLRKGKGLGDGA